MIIKKIVGENNYKIGKIDFVQDIVKDFVYFFDMKGSKYTSEVTKLSKLSKFLITQGVRMKETAESHKLNAYIPPEAHKELQEITQCAPDRLVYKILLQTITLIGCTNIDSEIENPCKKNP